MSDFVTIPAEQVNVVRNVLEMWAENELEVLCDAHNYMIDAEQGAARCEVLKQVAAVLPRLGSNYIIKQEDYDPSEYAWYDEEPTIVNPSQINTQQYEVIQ